ncbi:MAG: hypothetical protein ACRDQD_20430 [Nocardioidaceae bacterium]
MLHLPATPLELLPGRWQIEHWCTICRREVDTQDLVAHAQAHTHSNPTSDQSQRQPDNDA